MRGALVLVLLGLLVLGACGGGTVRGLRGSGEMVPAYDPDEAALRAGEAALCWARVGE